ncbi:restriction endonuclease subunit S [Virgibacillus alimentarius]|uniref:restriction endonuclease subunit S n=1 Tax=Virgibacillus alimentarius TaxID=698769 RepID=UPI000493505E|nr:restriction endonuclease subunit S [Virgibacillus alimentarius]
MGEKRLVPKRRFKGFEKNWDVITLEETSQKIGDGLHGTPKYDDNGSVYFINGNNIFNGKINFYKDTKTVTKYEQSSNDLLLDTDTILISVNGTIGNLAFYNGEEIMLGKSVAFIILKKNEKQYIFYYLQTPNVYNYFLNNLTGSTIKNLGLKQIKETEVALPVIKEQQRIGEFFNILDERIANQERKIAKVKDLKSAYLTEMFPKEGETVPKRRFKGFEDEWKTKRLGEISFINTGESDVKDSVSDGEYPFFVRSKNIENSDTYTYDGEAILIPGEGKLGEIYHYYNGKFNYHQRVYKISDFDENVDGKFIYYIMHTTFKQHALKHTVKATVDSLRLPTLTSYKFCLPNKKEQQKIGSFFKNLDNQIEMEEKKLDKLQKMKEAYLEEMFV